MEFEAEYFDGQTSSSRTVRVLVGSKELVLSEADGTNIAHWRCDLVRDENIPPIRDELFLSLSEANDARLRVSGRVKVQYIRERCNFLQKRRKRESKYYLKIVAGFALVGLITWYVLFEGFPALASAASGLLPVEITEKIGDATVEQIKKQAAKGNENIECVGHVAIDAISEFLVKLDMAHGIEEGDRPPVRKVVILKSNVKNAFAVPGGTIVIMDGLIKASKHPNALAGVIAHEYSHAAFDHPIRLYASNVGIAAFLSLLLGDTSGGTALAVLGQMMLGASYSRDLEEEADNHAIELMSKLSMDVSHMVPLLKSIQEDHSDSGFFTLFNSHPEMGERIEQIEKSGVTGAENAFNSTDWNSIRKMCE
ncbi:M48 family metalloprotease [Sneathiella sp. P13V-1]|uniref:M48 family metallopeptidase n=1 Tax=Sneathiella sp. P13V-1 TaxID=2697366 RepID=UPI00187B560C|nr:M48 family metallopeptidase [Sneathiella sp. P13V-1]MBE7636864.1 M48 family metalloprotease [Sneathiella sp. P13V-1]